MDPHVVAEQNECEVNDHAKRMNEFECGSISAHGEIGILQEERNIVRVKVQQKKGAKKVTIIENIPLDVRESVLCSLRKEMGCGGIVLDDKLSIQLQGDKTTSTGLVSSLKKYIKGCKVEMNGKIS
ncbi:hypothetical protein HK407_12g18280 [Ordospora pajunii]|uniref:uncharacterized protein n=1 Tax=Ordospora pajunii TaxID=3039483 RepID=UPI0029526853|nr:uncharacterized protein HK407_12g18280 [Ordospora pajunii]KAH9410696.1 hypothetical protein HK407_12g18280 [Ordospora pajunii]